jgi:hypothetical protein
MDLFFSQLDHLYGILRKTVKKTIRVPLQMNPIEDYSI